MTEVNVPLLRKVVEWAEAEAAKPWVDSLWEQSLWQMPAGHHMLNPETGTYAVKCDTAYCIAGSVVAMTLRDGESMGDDANVLVNGEFVAFCLERAAEELGITVDQREALFFCGNTIEQVREIAEAIAGERL